MTWDKYKSEMKQLGLVRYFGTQENAAKVFAASLRESYSACDIDLNDFMKALKTLVPILDDAFLGKVVHEALMMPRKHRRSGDKGVPVWERPPAWTTARLHAVLLANHIKSSRPDLNKSTSGPSAGKTSNPKLARMVYDLLRLAGAPSAIFLHEEKTVLEWLKPQDLDVIQPLELFGPAH